jgi:Zn-dependent protease
MKETSHFFPKFKPDSIKDPTADYLTYIESPKGLADVFEAFCDIAVIPFKLFTQRNDQMGGFITISAPQEIRGYLLALAMVNINIVWINLIPLPGLDFGNTIIALVEQKRRKKYDLQRLRKIRMTFSKIFILLLLALVIYNLSYLF